MRYTVEVVETRMQVCLYTVEAENKDQAVRLAMTGETIEETDIRYDCEVIAREVVEDSLQGESCTVQKND